MAVESTQSSLRSRRALLAGALGGLGAWAAAVAVRVDPAEAAAGDPIRMGRLNKASGTSTELQTSASKPAFRATQLGSGVALRGDAGSGRAVMAIAGQDGTGVWASSPNHYGVSSECPSGTAVRAVGDTAVLASGGQFGVLASGDIGIQAGGDSMSAQLTGRVYLDGPLDLVEQFTEPTAPPASMARLFAREVGGKTELCVKFAAGAVQVLATEP
jgi:hypothetical protein